ncbi:MAG: MBL fold metallo-hydrolase [Anaerolineae bacterium]|nr:MBL fold metallo-hydrolase [Anaerolineae bacterium]
MQIHYFGWSGIVLRNANTLIGFDLFGDAVTWDALKGNQVMVFCLTHGHPEHAGSLRAFLEASEARPYISNIHLISSPDVLQHVNRHGILAPENVHNVQAGESVTIEGVKVTTFTWVHMPLLPPGLRPKVEYIFQLILHPIDLIRIGMLGLSLPMNAPQLGFHITYPDGMTVLNYSEGVHRLTNPGEVEQVSRSLPADKLLFAVEPDDAEAIPRWVEMLAPKAVYVYEAHRPWRDLFHLPFIDLNEYADELSDRFHSMTFCALSQVGQVVASEGD